VGEGTEAGDTMLIFCHAVTHPPQCFTEIYVQRRLIVLFPHLLKDFALYH